MTYLQHIDREKLLPIGRFVFAGIFILFLISFYLPLTSKSVNNIFYVGLAFPSALIAANHFSQLKEILRDFYWFFLIILVISLLDFNEAKDLKEGVYLLLFFLTCVFLDRGQEKVKTYLLAFSAFSVLVLTIATVEWVRVWAETSQWKQPLYPFGKLIHTGFFGSLICFGVLSAWVFGISDWLENRSSKVLYALGFLVVCSLVLLSATVFQSRTALLGFAVFFFGFLWYQKQFVLGFLVVGFLLVVALVSGIYEILLERGLSHRVEIWQEVIRQLTTDCNIWIGCVPGEKILGQFYHPHNAYLAMLYRNGILGASVFLVFIVIFFARTIRVKSRWMLLSLFGWGCLLTEINSILTSPEPFWIYFWLPVLMAIIESQQKDPAGQAR
jgi:O-antigen ligase